MHNNKILSLSLITSVLVLAGCTTQTTTNTNTVTNTNAVNDNTNVAVVTNTNETVGNENTNTTNESGEVDTNDPALSEVEGWLTYTNETIGLEFDYPMPSNNMRFDFTDCSEVKCDSETGFSYNLNFFDEETSTGYAVVGASTLDFAAGRDLDFIDVAFFKKDGSAYKAILTDKNSFEIKPKSELDYPLGKVIIYEIKDLPSYPQLLDVQNERKNDTIGIYNFSNSIAGFDSISFRFTPKMSEEDIDRVLNSVKPL